LVAMLMNFTLLNLTKLEKPRKDPPPPGPGAAFDLAPALCVVQKERGSDQTEYHGDT
jgi:hypothetical protein